MKLSKLWAVPVLSLGTILSCQSAAMDAAWDASQAKISPSPLALLCLGGLVGICFFVQRTR